MNKQNSKKRPPTKGQLMQQNADLLDSNKYLYTRNLKLEADYTTAVQYRDAQAARAEANKEVADAAIALFNGLMKVVLADAKLRKLGNDQRLTEKVSASIVPGSEVASTKK